MAGRIVICYNYLARAGGRQDDKTAPLRLSPPSPPNPASDTVTEFRRHLCLAFSLVALYVQYPHSLYQIIHNTEIEAKIAKRKNSYKFISK